MILLKQNLFTQIVCSDIEPEYNSPEIQSGPTSSFDELPDGPIYTDEFIRKMNQALRENGFAYSGTQLGWALKDNCPACACEDTAGRWHYIFHC